MREMTFVRDGSSAFSGEDTDWQLNIWQHCVTGVTVAHGRCRAAVARRR
jgi:hypothetical protein